MKKLLFLTLFFVQALFAMGQFQDNVNISLFTGGYLAPQNANNNGHWYGIYAEYMPIKTTNGLNIGFCAVASRSTFQSNDTLMAFEGTSNDFGIGIAAGKYFETFSFRYASYFGFNAMIKSSLDNGESQAIGFDGRLGKYNAQQNDLMFAAGLNFNLLKNFGMNENLFPRTQLRLALQEPLNSGKSAYWNDLPVSEVLLWNKAAYSAEFKQSIFQAGQFDLMFEPKLYLGYYHYKGDGSNWLAAGPELALKIRGWDDFLSLYFLVKQQVGEYVPHFNERQFVFGLNFIPTNLKKY